MTMMLKQLKEFYAKNEILSTNFNCKHLKSCKRDCKDFTEAKSAYAGSGYEAGKLPKLLFVSADPGTDGGIKDPKRRLPEQVRQGEEGEWSVNDDLHKGSHWGRTYELAWYILKRFDSHFEDIENVKGFFAHANAAKCCMNNPQNAQADNILFNNCKGYLEGELKILAPDLLVTQGEKADKAVTPLIEITKTVDENCAYHGVLHGKPIFWLSTFHPNNRKGDFAKQRKGGEGWKFYAEEMHRFINHPPGS